jgi:5-methylcytosine-specific restriction endonuclease McrA
MLRAELGDARGPNGRQLCTWCRTEIPPRRRHWCSQACVEAYLDLHDWNRIRERVLARDAGICALCRTDTLALLRRARRHRWDAAWLAAHGIPFSRRRKDLWDADHILPVTEGGDNRLENLRTLCVACHQNQTALLRERLKQRRAIRKAVEAR